ncbi:MAG: RidA family protein [Actinomycetota bacterium]
MPKPEVVPTPGAPAAAGPYSPAVRGGAFLFCSGQIALDPASGKMVGGGVPAETTQVLSNLSAVLAGAGLGLDSVVKTTVFLLSMDDFPAMNEVYQAAFGDHRPARSTIAVVGLPRGARVEIEAVAVLPG